MPVTEIALLSLKQIPNVQHSSSISSKTLHNLQHAVSEQAKYSGYPVALIQCHTGPTKLFLLGGWDTVSHHMDNWIPGPVNQELLKLLSSDIEVKYMFHLDAHPLSIFHMLRGALGIEECRVFVGLYTMQDPQRSTFEAALRGDAGSSELSFGWKLDLGYFADDASSGMQDGQDTVIVVAVHKSESENSQPSTLAELEANCQGKDVHSGKVISFVSGSRQADYQS